MESLLIWSSFFCTLSLALSFGYYGMANPNRSVLWELSAFGISGCAALLCAVAISAIGGGGISFPRVLGIVALAVLFATLLGGIPRLVYQVWQKNHWSLSFLFRLSAYVAVLVVIGQAVDPDVLILIPATIVLGLGFFATIAFGKAAGKGWGVWLLVPLAAYFLMVPTVTILSFHDQQWDFATLMGNLSDGIWPTFDEETLGQALGTVLFLVLTLGTHALIHHLAPSGRTSEDAHSSLEIPRVSSPNPIQGLQDDDIFS